MPGHAALDLREIDVFAVPVEQLADDAPVAIALVPFDIDGLAEGEAAQRLLRTGAEGLGLLRGVDAEQADGVARTGFIEDLDGIAVGNADDATGEQCGMAWGKAGEAEQEQ